MYESESKTKTRPVKYLSYGGSNITFYEIELLLMYLPRLSDMCRVV